MKFIFTIILCLAVKLLIAQAFTPGSNLDFGTKLDTNAVVYDSKGKVIKYAQYKDSLKTGNYIVRLSGDPLLPGTKAFLTKITAEDKLRMEEAMKGNGKNNLILKVNERLDATPLAKALNKDFFSSKIIMMVFWHPDCGPCVPRIAELNTVLKGLNSDNVVVLLITTGDQASSEARLQNGPLFNARLVSDAANIQEAYKVTALPFYVIADDQRTIRYAATGLGPTHIVRAKSLLEELLGMVPAGRNFTPDMEYSILGKKAYDFMVAKKYEEASQAYEALFTYSRGFGTMGDNYNAACAWSKLGDKEKAFLHLEKAVVVNQWANVAHIRTDPDLEPLHSDKRWQPLIDKVIVNAATQQR